jgi:hypothetical protein
MCFLYYQQSVIAQRICKTTAHMKLASQTKPTYSATKFNTCIKQDCKHVYKKHVDQTGAKRVRIWQLNGETNADRVGAKRVRKVDR